MKLKSSIGGQLLFDVFAWLFAISLSAASRYDFALPNKSYASILLVGMVAALLQVVWGKILHLYRGRFIVEILIYSLDFIN